MEARDRPAVVGAFAEDGVVHPPFTDNLAFTGREQIDPLIGVVFEV
jgi:hypothetical protein